MNDDFRKRAGRAMSDAEWFQEKNLPKTGNENLIIKVYYCMGKLLIKLIEIIFKPVAKIDVGKTNKKSKKISTKIDLIKIFYEDYFNDYFLSISDKLNFFFNYITAEQTSKKFPDSNNDFN